MDYIQEIKNKWLNKNKNQNIIDINIEVTKKEENYSSVIFFFNVHYTVKISDCFVEHLDDLFLKEEFLL